MKTATKPKSDLKSKDPKVAFPNARDRIVYAFTLGETHYFQFDDINAIPCERGFQALAFYNEMNERCTREYLLAHSQAMDNILNDARQIKITDLVKLNMQLKERLEWLFEPEIAYKLCTVVFFDATENPYRFEYQYSLRKADFFRRAKMDDFFLSKPIVKLIPYISSFSSDFQEYCQMVLAINQKHIENISTMLSEADKKKDWYRLLVSHLSKDSASKKLEDYLSMSTT